MNPFDELMGKSAKIGAVRETIERLLRRQSDARRLPPVLIEGETGTGKGLVARILHAASPRRPGPFVDVNCAAIPETMLEAELFGYERGAFTDARQAKPGLFQTAHHGTLFLDEIGLLPEGLQGKLLTVIEERTVRRLGSTRNEPVDVWVLSASNVDLAGIARQGRFRMDLYHRLTVLTVSLPPLRERGDDILVLADHFLARACAEYGLSPKALAPDAREALLAYRWPGNVRELANVMERVALLTDARLVTAELVALPATAKGEPRGRQPVAEAHEGEGVVTRLERERTELLETLQQTNWNLSRAATRLGIPRNTLRYRMAKHQLRPGVSAPSAPGSAVPTPAVEAPAPEPSGGAAPTGVRWEVQHLTLVRVAPLGTSTAEPPAVANWSLELAVEKVQSFGGSIAELGPTGLVAVFGLDPVEDSASRAAHAALAIERMIELGRRSHPATGRVRIAIHSGQCPVGHVGGTAQMDPEAKRRMSLILDALVADVEADGIRVSEAAAVFLQRRFELRPAATVEGAPARVYGMVGRERTGFALGGRTTKFVDRSQELGLLHSRFVSALNGRGQVVGIGGEAGIGKTRLLYEFVESLPQEAVRSCQGRCYSYGTTTPYLPIVELVREFFGTSESDAPAVVVEKLRAGLQEIGVDRDPAAPCLTRLVGVRDGSEPLDALSPEAIRTRTFESLRQIALHTSRRRPLVLTVENLQWIDITSEAFLASLVDGLPGARLLLVVTYRPGYRPSWIDKSYATQITLQPLGRPESLAIIQSVLQAPEVRDSLAERILTKGEGNPFFLEELTRTMVERGTAEDAGTLPDTIQEVLRSRIARLSSEPRRLLQTAAVLGREVSLRLLTAVWAHRDSLETSLRELTRLEFLYERAEPEITYAFAHGLTREVARDSLPVADRTALHAGAGQALETLYADRLEDVYDRLAYHYSKAKDPEKAIEYDVRFAERAAQNYANAEAVAALDDALVHAERLPTPAQERTRIELLLRKAHSLSFLGRFPDLSVLLRREEDRVRELQTGSLTAPYYFWLSHTESHLGNPEQATRAAELAIGDAEVCGDHGTAGRAHVVLAEESYWAGHPLRGVEQGRRAVELLERSGDRWWQGLARWAIGINYILLGDFDQALEAAGQALSLGQAIGDPRIQSYATWSIGWIYALSGRSEAGIEACTGALGSSSDPVNTAVALGHLGYVHLERGDFAQAIALLEQALSQMRQFGFSRLEARFTTFLGEAYLLAGQPDRAREFAGQGLQLSADAGYRYGIGWSQLALGRIARAHGALAEAERHLKKALDVFEGIPARFMMARTHLALADVTGALGNPEAAVTHLRAGHSLAQALRVQNEIRHAEALAMKVGVPLAGEGRDCPDTRDDTGYARLLK